MRGFLGVLLSALLALPFAPTANAQLARNLTVQLLGQGSGVVDMGSFGLCPQGTCTVRALFVSPVILTARANPGSSFAGWGGGCTGVGSCTAFGGSVVTATFLPFESPFELTPAALAFDPQSMLTTSPARTLTIRNKSGTVVAIFAVEVQGEGFAATHDCGRLDPGQACSARVTFTPPARPVALNAASTMAASLSIASDAPGSPHLVALSGIGEKSLVTHYYSSILRRAPDQAGKDFWLAEAARVVGLQASVNEVWYAMAMSFFFSPEYALQGRDDAGFVTDLYRTFFNRNPDPGGFDFWMAQIAGGMPREGVLANFMFSPEFAIFTQALFGPPAARAEANAMIDFYRGLLSRLPDSAGFNFYLQRSRVAQCLGQAAVIAQVDDISSGYLSSPEYANRGRTHAQFMADMYNAFMRRGPDLSGINFYVGQLNVGGKTREQIRREFKDSAEFTARTAAVVAQGCLSGICDATLEPTGRGHTKAAGSGGVTVRVADACPWSVQSDSPSWLRATQTGTGTGDFGYEFDANPGALRLGRIILTMGIAGAASPRFTVSQQGGVVTPPPPNICFVQGLCQSNNVCCPRGMVGCDGKCYSSVTAAYSATLNPACLSATTLCPN